MTSITIPASMKAPMFYTVSSYCCCCEKELNSDETYFCQYCNDEIDRRADETLGNAEGDDETNA